jgi:hypothetical protein
MLEFEKSRGAAHAPEPAEGSCLDLAEQFASENSVELKGGSVMTTFDKKLNMLWEGLRIGLGLVPFLAGLDKFFNLLTNWQMYLSPVIEPLLPFSATTSMQIVGVIEMIAGLAVLTRWTRLGSYVVSAWLVLIAANLVSTGMFLDVAVRDLALALAAFTLARLTELKEMAQHQQTPPAREAPELRRAG